MTRHTLLALPVIVLLASCEATPPPRHPPIAHKAIVGNESKALRLEAISGLGSVDSPGNVELYLELQIGSAERVDDVQPWADYAYEISSDDVVMERIPVTSIMWAGEESLREQNVTVSHGMFYVDVKVSGGPTRMYRIDPGVIGSGRTIRVKVKCALRGVASNESLCAVQLVPNPNTGK